MSPDDRIDELEAKIERLNDQLFNLRESVFQRDKRIEKLEDRVAELEAVVETDMDSLEYEQMTKQDKVRVVQQKLVEDADGKANGKAAMNYRNVKWLFDRKPSPGHCYDLMRLAGQEPGFEYQEFSGDKTNRLIVDLGEVKAPSAFHAVNKAAKEEGGQ